MLRILFTLFFIIPVSLQTNTWNAINPLVSTRFEVEKILGKPLPDSKRKYSAFYKTKNEKIFVVYSTGCASISDEPSSGWNTPLGKVISISVEPVIKPKVTSYEFDKSKYKSYKIGDYGNFTDYINEKDGVSFTVDDDSGDIINFRYFPKSKENYLMCKNQ